MASEIGADVVAIQPSPSGRLTAVIRSADSKPQSNADVASMDFVVEIWTPTRRVRRIAVQKQHKALYVDGYLGYIVWSNDETKLCYVAEEKTVQATSFFSDARDASDPSKLTSQDEAAIGHEFDAQLDWGETHIGAHLFLSRSLYFLIAVSQAKPTVGSLSSTSIQTSTPRTPCAASPSAMRWFAPVSQTSTEFEQRTTHSLVNAARRPKSRRADVCQRRSLGVCRLAHDAASPRPRALLQSRESLLRRSARRLWVRLALARSRCRSR